MFFITGPQKYSLPGRERRKRRERKYSIVLIGALTQRPQHEWAIQQYATDGGLNSQCAQSYVLDCFTFAGSCTFSDLHILMPQTRLWLQHWIGVVSLLDNIKTIYTL